nr:uncharacterized mitochondrial protein AtMg00810-like [Tanacetum cinerariifolium]GEZ60289.1 uncharacterized mitochondrial protein AtMg00810-like [Tanacetum cinerariifolium]GEZ67199.1 uncharacterized mitochondrial protein AtMg00810-like [Tanacetum cinerariifolium]
MMKKNKLDEDIQGTPVDATLYRDMIGSLMYLTSSRPDLIYAVCLCARYQAKPTEKHLNAEQVENGLVELYFVRTEYQLADIFTKPLPKERFNFLIEKLGMRSMSPEMLKCLTEEEDEGWIMNPQETQQVAARDEKLVPFAERVKISSTNIRLETTMPQKEETFQVIIDVIKNSTRFKAFTISVDVPKIFMQPFWYTIKKVQDTKSYEFLLANKKCTINAEVFRTVLNICPRVEGVNFTDVPDDDTGFAAALAVFITEASQSRQH